MEISGKIIHVGTPMGGVSSRTGNRWASQDFVIETIEQYPRRCCFNVFGEDKLRDFHLREGDIVKAFIDIDAHEYNGRWFNEIRAWKITRN